MKFKRAKVKEFEKIKELVINWNSKQIFKPRLEALEKIKKEMIEKEQSRINFFFSKRHKSHDFNIN